MRTWPRNWTVCGAIPSEAVNVEGSEARTMAETLATKSSLPGYEGPGTFEAARARALVAPPPPPPESPSPRQSRRAVTATVQGPGVRRWATRMAREFGDHPGNAVARVRWALATIET